jgi:hypothetical protein
MSMDELDPIITDETLRQRIRQLVETPKSDKTTRVAQTLRHPLTGLVFGFLLTGVVGSIVAAGFQQRADKDRFDQEIREARRASALTTVDTVGFLLNRTYYLFGEYWDAIKRRDLPRTERKPVTSSPFTGHGLNLSLGALWTQPAFRFTLDRNCEQNTRESWTACNT